MFRACRTCPTTIWSTLVMANTSTLDAANGRPIPSTALALSRRKPGRRDRGDWAMKIVAETTLPAIRPQARLMRPCPVAKSQMVTATASQLSTWSIRRRRRGARRSIMALGAATTPLMTTLSAMYRITPAAAGAPMVPAKAGAPS